jgi:hypothetical protein
LDAVVSAEAVRTLARDEHRAWRRRSHLGQMVLGERAEEEDELADRPS